MTSKLRNLLVFSESRTLAAHSWLHSSLHIDSVQPALVTVWSGQMLLLLLLTPDKILKKTENRVLLSVSEWGPSTAGKLMPPDSGFSDPLI